jgi:hypothetical protein
MARTDIYTNWLVAASASLVLWLASAPADAFEVKKLNGVVELFTSQGCSSCPPADRILRELATKGETLALAWHVDYWDYLGWKDTFASRANTQRQRGYARSLHESQIYTPQAVINGRTHVVGSNRAAIEGAVARLAGDGQGLLVPIETTVEDGSMKVHVTATGRTGDASLWMVYFNDRALVDVTRGENAGKKLAYSNIVRAVELIGMVKDSDLQTEFRIADLSRRGHDSCALILQQSGPDGSPGPILGAALIRALSN